MLEPLMHLPPGVIGFEVADKLTAQDFRDVLLPAIQEAGSSGEIRIVMVVPEFHGLTPEALWQDLKMGVENWRAWKRIALVTDVAWMGHATEWFGWMTPGDVKHFPLDQQADAIAWVSGSSRRP